MSEKRYIAMFSVHGLLRGFDMELGRDSDTGGQITYVVELARALHECESVGRVDLFTRKIIDKNIDASYSVEREPLTDRVTIVRIPCGPRRYLRKESLWPYLPGFVDNTLQYFRSRRRVPDIIHGHYADAGYVGGQLARLLGVPFVFTGHSLGRVKRERMEKKGARMEVADRKFNFPRRIEAEEFALETASLVVASTRQEVREQYEVYHHYNPHRMRVIAPGVDLKRFYPPEGPVKTRMSEELKRFLKDPEKPMILAMARPDDRKNIATLVRAYAEDKQLREWANLVLILGSRDDIQKMEHSARRVLANLFYLFDFYDLYGSVAFPKSHAAEEVPDIYRLGTASKGVFVNPALTEPFGLTLIEAAASGMPIVATNNGGPNDIIETLDNGLLVDPLDGGAIAAALKKIVSDSGAWQTYSENGVERSRTAYSWKAHVDTYIDRLNTVFEEEGEKTAVVPSHRSRLPTIDRVVVTDVDNTLTGDDEGTAAFLKALSDAGEFTAFGIATGRSKESALEALNEAGAPVPDIMITSAGAAIYYGEKLTPDVSWEKHIHYRWYPDSIRNALDKLPGLYPQPKEQQHPYKLSYTINLEESPPIHRVRKYLRECELRAKVIFSLGMYLDIMPIRASTGLAIRYLAFKWGLSPDHLLVAGDSGNDEEMLDGHTLGVVVGNYSSELEKLRGRPRIYFTEACHAWGILEGIQHYNFFGEINIPVKDEVSNETEST